MPRQTMTLFIDWIKAVTDWVRALVCWLSEPKYLWFAIIVTLAPLVVCILLGPTERIIRMSGLVLQLLGVGTVISEIRGTRKLFNLPSLLTIARCWFARVPRFREQTTPISFHATLPAMECLFRGYEMNECGVDASVEDRLAVLEKNIILTNQRINQTQREMDDAIRDANNALEQEVNKRASEDQSIHDKLEATGTGGIHISAIGVLWLLVGVTLSTASQEIAKLFQ